MRAKGFTLIELLTTIGVIGILAGLALPVMSRAKASARLVSCIANQKSLASALTVKAQDYQINYFNIFDNSSANEHRKELDELSEFSDSVRELMYSNLHPDNFFGKYDVFRPKLWNCPDTNEGQVTTPFSIMWGWAINRKESVAWNYEVDTFRLVFNDYPKSKDYDFIVSDRYGFIAGYESKSEIPYNPSFDKFNVTFRDGMLHRYKGGGAVQTRKDLSTRWVSLGEILDNAINDSREQ